MINPPIRQIVTQSDPKKTVPFGSLKKMSQLTLFFRSACINFAAQISQI